MQCSAAPSQSFPAQCLVASAQLKVALGISEILKRGEKREKKKEDFKNSPPLPLLQLL